MPSNAYFPHLQVYNLELMLWGGEVLRVIGMDSNFSGCAHGTFMAVVHIRLPTALIEGGG